jgi:HK97 family phage portal protein
MQQLREFFGITNWTDLLPIRASMAQSGHPYVSPDTALRNSAVWACLRLRADLLSTLPLTVFRKARMDDGSQVNIEVTTPQVLVTPGGRVSLPEWLYSSQVDLDRVGNAIGIIRERDGNGLPARIDLQLSQTVSILTHDNQITGYRIGNAVYNPGDIWHEKQFTVAGLPVGLSPLAYAAWTLGRWQSVEQFAIGWFSGGGVPRARLQNVAKKIDAGDATVVKEAWRAAIAVGEPFVHGSDWTYDLIQAQQASTDWLESQNASVLDVSRFFGAPADMIDAIVMNTTRITYANVTQRHLQFLITHLRPAIRRREWNLSTLTQSPRFVKLDADDLLQMDPATRADYLKTLIDGRICAPSEAREFMGKPPFTQAQIDELLLFYPPKNPLVTPGPGGGAASVGGQVNPAAIDGGSSDGG